jgi:hypothetical protein
MLALAACGRQPSPPASASAPSTSAPDTSAAGASAPVPGVATDRWLGHWTGPEGTYLDIVGGHGRYAITIRNLDGARTFDGTGQGDRIAFERDGAAESLHATNGAETGMKWLAEKSNCLTVRTGEGYCRD